VKVAAEHQPVPPAAVDGSPFVQVEFEGLTVTPYVDESHGRPRVAYSIRATGMRAPTGGRNGRSTHAAGADKAGA
jgi:hypothetical protein